MNSITWHKMCYLWFYIFINNFCKFSFYNLLCQNTPIFPETSFPSYSRRYTLCFIYEECLPDGFLKPITHFRTFGEKHNLDHFTKAEMSHSNQIDWSSCGILVCKFAYAFWHDPDQLFFSRGCEGHRSLQDWHCLVRAAKMPRICDSNAERSTCHRHNKRKKND